MLMRGSHMSSESKLRVLEGLGYVSAFMIGVGGIVDSKALDYFNALGLVFAIIVIVRLMVMNIMLGAAQQLFVEPDDFDDEPEDFGVETG